MAPLQSQKSTAPQRQGDQLQIQHFTHQHLLHKLFTASEFNCDGCKARGHGIRYRCSACSFDLHEQCATSSHHLSSHLHPQHELILVNRPGNSHFCDVCKGLTDGLSYTCQMCEFDVHPLCTQIPVATGVPSLTLNPCQQQVGVTWGQPTPAVGGYHEVNNNRPVIINQQQQQQQQQQGVPTTAFGGYHGVNTNQPVMVNHHNHQQQQQGIPTTVFGGYNGFNDNSKHAMMMMNQQQGTPTTSFGGYNNSQPVMMNQQQQGMPTTSFGGYQGPSNSQPVMMNQQQQQQQGILPTTSFGGYNNSRPVNVMKQQQQQVIPSTSTFGGYHGASNNSQLVMVNHHPHQQHQGMATAAFGGYHGLNNNQPMMINQQQQQQQAPARSNSLSKVGKLAANVLMTSLIGVPINFNSRN